MLTYIGRSALRFLEYFGELAALAAETVLSIVQGSIRWKLLMRQIVEVGFVIELGFLNGRAKLGDVPVRSVVTY